MTETASSFDDVMRALPAVQAALRAEIAARIAAGEIISRVEGDKVIATRPPTRDLAARRKELMEEFAAGVTKTDGTERKAYPGCSR